MNILSKRFISVSKLLLDTSYSLRCWIIVQRVRIAGSVLVGNFLKIHFQGFPSSLYTRKRCSSISSHGIFLLVLIRSCSSSLQHPSSPLLGSGLLSLRRSSLLIAPELSPDVSSRPALPCRSRVCALSLSRVWSSACGVRVFLPLGETRDEV